MQSLRLIAGYDPCRPETVDVLKLMCVWVTRLPEATKRKLFPSLLEAVSDLDSTCRAAIVELFTNAGNLSPDQMDAVFEHEDRLNDDMSLNETMRMVFATVINQATESRTAMN